MEDTTEPHVTAAYYSARTPNILAIRMNTEELGFIFMAHNPGCEPVTGTMYYLIDKILIVLKESCCVWLVGKDCFGNVRLLREKL